MRAFQRLPNARNGPFVHKKCHGVEQQQRTAADHVKHPLLETQVGQGEVESAAFGVERVVDHLRTHQIVGVGRHNLVPQRRQVQRRHGIQDFLGREVFVGEDHLVHLVDAHDFAELTQGAEAVFLEVAAVFGDAHRPFDFHGIVEFAADQLGDSCGFAVDAHDHHPLFALFGEEEIPRAGVIQNIAVEEGNHRHRDGGQAHDHPREIDAREKVTHRRNRHKSGDGSGLNRFCAVGALVSAGNPEEGDENEGIGGRGDVVKLRRVRHLVLLDLVDVFPVFLDADRRPEYQQRLQSREGNPLGNPATDREECPQVNRKPDDQRVKTRAALGKVFVGEDDHRVVKHLDIVQAALFRGFALVMDDLGAREVIIFVAAERDAVAQVDVFAIHEEGLVEQADLVETSLPHEHIGPRKHVHDMVLLLVEVTQMVFAKRLALGKQPAQPENLVEGDPRRGQPAFALGEEAALAVDHLHAERTRVGVGVHEFQAFLERRFLDHRVGIEEQDVFAGGDAHREVVARREAEVFLAFDQRNVGEAFAEHRLAAIHRIVVHHIHLRIDALDRSTHREQALLDEMLDIVIDDDDGKPLQMPLPVLWVSEVRLISDRASVISSVNSRSEPTGMPLAMLEVRTPNSSSLRAM